MQTTIIPVNLGFVKVFLVKGDRTVLVDAGLKGSSGRIFRAMERNGIRREDVSLILVTHAHGDHTGGLKELQEATGAPVAVHRLEERYVAEGLSARAEMRSAMMRFLGLFFRGQRIGSAQPSVLIDGPLSLAEYGVDAVVIHTPGHTEGSLTLVTAAGEAIAGDMVGGSLRPALPGVYADLHRLKDSIRALEKHGIQRVYTCHGGVHRLQDVLRLAD